MIQPTHCSADLVTLDPTASKKVDFINRLVIFRALLVLHVCLDMLCFCLLKIIAVATLYSQLLILKHFKKKIIKKKRKFLDFRQKSEIEKIFLKFFHWKSYWKSKILKFWNFWFFDFQYDFQWKFFENIFEIFEIFKNFEIFSISDVFRKSRKFQLFLMIFFKVL